MPADYGRGHHRPPGRAGPVTVTVRVLRENYRRFAIKEAPLALEPPGTGKSSIERAAIRKPDGTWQVVEIDIEQPGIWTVRVIVVPVSGPPVALDAPHRDRTLKLNDCW